MLDRSQQRWLLVATVLGSSMAFIDGAVVNLALPALQTGLGATESGVQWVVEGYTLALAAFLLVGGAAGDVYGHARVFVTGAILFALASVGCGASHDLAQLVVARGVQGIGGAMLVPGSLALINALLPSDRRAAAIGTWSGWLALTGAGGPVLGGWLVQHASWRWVFFVNVPLALVVVAIVKLALPSTPRAQGGRLDWIGALLAMLGLGALVLGLVEWRRGATFIVVAELVGVVALGALILVEHRVPRPMLPLALFRSRAFTGANLVTLLLYTSLSGVLFFLPLDLIQVQHLSPTQAGAALLPFVALLTLLSTTMGRLVDKVGARVLLTSGTLVSAVGLALFMLPGSHARYARGFLPGILVLGLGMSIVVAPLTTVVMSAVDDAHAGSASGINNAVSRVGGLLAVAVFGLLLGGTFTRALPVELARRGVAQAEAARVAGQADRLAAIETSSDGAAYAVRDAFVAGYRRVLAVSCGLALLAAAVALVTIPGREGTMARRGG